MEKKTFKLLELKYGTKIYMIKSEWIQFKHINYYYHKIDKESKRIKAY